MANENINGLIGKLTSGSLLRLRRTGICDLRRKESKIQETMLKQTTKIQANTNNDFSFF